MYKWKKKQGMLTGVDRTQHGWWMNSDPENVFFSFFLSIMTRIVLHVYVTCVLRYLSHARVKLIFKENERMGTTWIYLNFFLSKQNINFYKLPSNKQRAKKLNSSYQWIRTFFFCSIHGILFYNSWFLPNGHTYYPRARNVWPTTDRLSSIYTLQATDYNICHRKTFKWQFDWNIYTYNYFIYRETTFYIVLLLFMNIPTLMYILG